jgi:hypothetical protein
MTTPRTRSQIGKASRAKGAAFERAVANAIRPWFPDVRRSRDNGSATTTDTGDLVGTPGVYWSLKDVAAARTDPSGLIAGWLAEAAEKADGAVPLLVIKRAGHADPLASWCWLWLDDIGPSLPHIPTRMELRHALDLLAAAGGEQTPDLKEN